MSGRPITPGAAFRAELPLLAKPGLVWLDHASTTPTARVALEAMVHHSAHDHGNVHRGVHPQGEAATAAYETARAQVAAAVGAPDPRCVVFTGGATAALNLAAWGWSRLRPGDRVLLSAMEHHASLLPWRAAARAAGAELVTLPLHPTLGVDPEATLRALPGAAALVVTARSNVIGVAPPLAELCAAARRLGVLTVVDAAQAAAWDRAALAEIGCDLLALSGHKVYGPTGVGALVVHPERLDRGRPLLLGGGMVSHVGASDETFRPAPWGLEAGTPPVAQAVGLAAAMGLLDAVEGARGWVTALTERLLEGLAGAPGVQVVGDLPAHDRGGIVSFHVAGVHPHDVAEVLGQQGVAVQAGQHCAAPLLAALGLEATVRVSLGPANLPDDVHALLAGLRRVREVFP